MGPIGRWLVPLFLLLLGAVLIFDAYALNADANTILPFQMCNVTPWQGECGLAQFTGFLGAITVIAGIWMTIVRWWRARAPGPPASDPLGTTVERL